MIFVVAEIQVAAGKRAEFLKEFEALIPQVRAEEGCIEYAAAVDAETDLDIQLRKPETVTVIEKWSSLDALNVHLQAPHMQAYRERVKELVEGVTLRVLESPFSA